MLLWPCTYNTDTCIIMYTQNLSSTFVFAYCEWNFNNSLFSLFTPSLYCNNLVKLDFLYSTQYMILYGIHLHGMHLSHMHNYPHEWKASPNYRRFRSISSTIFTSLCLDFLFIWSTEFINASNCLFEYSCKTDNVIFRLNVEPCNDAYSIYEFNDIQCTCKCDMNIPSFNSLSLILKLHVNVQLRSLIYLNLLTL